ncbi:MAG TPA: hypothetical protein V6C57_06035 [Coleofasciculaceae cyanobacterium]
MRCLRCAIAFSGLLAGVITGCGGGDRISDRSISPNSLATSLNQSTNGTELAGRVIVAAKPDRWVKMPAWDESWKVKYQFVVPPLPTATWNPSQSTLYIWGDITFDAYGSEGAYRLSDYKFNQIVPQLFLGRVLSGSQAGFTASWSQQNTWVIQSQYFWQKDNTPYAQVGSMVNVNSGDIITTTIVYSPQIGKITASISAPAGTSSIVIDRPFPNQPHLFANWADFLKKAQLATRGHYVLAIPEMNVEPWQVDKQTMCTLLPFVVKGIDLPNVGTASADYAQFGVENLPCAQSAVELAF